MGKVKSELWNETDGKMEILPPDYQNALDNNNSGTTNMSNINSLRKTRFISRGDVSESPLLVTVESVNESEDISSEGNAPDLQVVMHFKENIKPLVMNWTNMQLCAAATGTEEAQSWAGNQIVLYDDPSIQFAGKITGGVRIRPKKTNAQAAPAPTAAAPGDDPNNDDIPY